MVEERGTDGGAVKCVEIIRNTKGEGTFLGHFPDLIGISDAETRKLGERSRLDTCVVLALNVCLLDVPLAKF